MDEGLAKRKREITLAAIRDQKESSSKSANKNRIGGLRGGQMTAKPLSIKSTDGKSDWW